MACQRRWTKLTVALYWVLMKRNMNLPNDFSDVSWCLFALFVSKNSWRFLQFSLMRKCSLNITQKPCSPIQLYSSQSQTYCRRRNCLYTLQVFCIEPRTSGLMIYNSCNSFVDRWEYQLAPWHTTTIVTVPDLRLGTGSKSLGASVYLSLFLSSKRKVR